MNLVDEQDVAILEVGQQRGQIARLGDDRPGRRAKAHAHFARDDLRERRLAQPRRAEKQHMVERIAPRLRRLDEHAQIVARRLLTDEFVERFGAQRRVDILRLAGGRGEGTGVVHLVSFRVPCRSCA